MEWHSTKLKANTHDDKYQAKHQNVFLDITLHDRGTDLGKREGACRTIEERDAIKQ